MFVGGRAVRANEWVGWGGALVGEGNGGDAE